MDDPGGPIARVRTGDLVRVDAVNGTMEVQVAADEWHARTPEAADLAVHHSGMGRELFAMFRNAVTTAEEGAATFGLPPLIRQVDPEINQPGGEKESKEFSDEDTLIRSNSGDATTQKEIG